MEDAQIIELFFHRSEEAVRALAETYGGVCRRLAVNALKNDQDAEECVNDTYLAVWNAVPPARPLTLLPYLCRIVRNLSIECYRRRHAAKRDDCSPAPGTNWSRSSRRQTRRKRRQTPGN